MIERNSICKYLINEWIILFTHWDNKVMIESIVKQITPVKTYFIFNSKNFTIKLEWQIINKWLFFCMLLRLIRESHKPLCMCYKTDPHCGSKKEKRNDGKVKNNEKMSTVMPFIQFFLSQTANQYSVMLL